MSETIVVLGIDAADYRLLQRWDCTNVLLENHAQLTTFSHSLYTPTTLEVWPSIATGVRPDRHGIVPDPTERADTHFLKKVAIAVLSQLPERIETGIRARKTSQYDSTFPQTNHDHVFETGSVYNWPGVTPCFDWSEESDWFQAINSGEMTEQEFHQRHLGNAGKGIGWLLGQAVAGIPIAGAHIHILDHMGHLYANRPEKLRKFYKKIDDMVEMLRERIDRLVILSDHGMQTTATDDPNPGVHSSRATFATTEESELPGSVLDVRAWLTDRLSHDVAYETTTRVDAPRDHLEDLGYL